MNRFLNNSLSASDNNRRSAPVRPSRSQQVMGPVLSPAVESVDRDGEPHSQVAVVHLWTESRHSSVGLARSRTSPLFGLFGCRVLILNHSKYPKFGPRARPGVLLSFGMPNYSFGTYKLMDAETRRVVYSRDVVFFEDLNAQDTRELRLIDQGISDVESSPSSDSEVDLPSTVRRSSRIRSPTYNSTFARDLQARLDEIGGLPNTPIWLSALAVLATSRAVEGSEDIAAQCSVLEPKNFKEAEKSETWRAAMDVEIEALKSKNTFEVVPRQPHMQPIPCKWIFKWKAHEARAKARIVVMG